MHGMKQKDSKASSNFCAAPESKLDYKGGLRREIEGVRAVGRIFKPRAGVPEDQLGCGPSMGRP
jgi:hypothetical protein